MNEPGGNQQMKSTIPVASLDHSDVPYVTDQPGFDYQLLSVDLDAGMWVTRSRFQPGFALPTHRHTGPVHGFTISGHWRYREYGVIYAPESYVFEPALSVHTLEVPEDAEEPAVIWFAIWGSFINFRPDGSILNIIDAGTRLDSYLAACEKAGYPSPKVLRR
jgi:2,4'-dihydroxyacetophenone dioxygenase